jgi:uncharacterized iron-regulated membrane protein
MGLLLSIYGISGSLLVFHAEINEFLHPDILVVDVPNHPNCKPLVDIFTAGRKNMSAKAIQTFVTFPRNEHAAFQLVFSLDDENGVTQRWLVGVNPYNAQLTGKQLLGVSTDILPRRFIDFVFELHYALLLPWSISSPIVALSGMLLIISTLTGLIVWWPLTGRWRQALAFKTGTGKIRLNYELHRLSGFYTLIIMIPVLFSGVYMVAPQHVVPLIEMFSPVTYRYWFKSLSPDYKKEMIDMEQAVAIAIKQYPNGSPNIIYGATEPTKTYMVCLDGVDVPGSILERRCTVIDSYNGKVLDLDDPSLPNATAGEIFTHWQWPLHSGQAFGMTGRVLIFITGLICPILFATGIIRWLQKRKALKTKNDFAIRQTRPSPPG